jgi:hypothetical protein
MAMSGMQLQVWGVTLHPNGHCPGDGDRLAMWVLMPKTWVSLAWIPASQRARAFTLIRV